MENVSPLGLVTLTQLTALSHKVSWFLLELWAVGQQRRVHSDCGERKGEKERETTIRVT